MISLSNPTLEISIICIAKDDYDLKKKKCLKISPHISGGKICSEKLLFKFNRKRRKINSKVWNIYK